MGDRRPQCAGYRWRRHPPRCRCGRRCGHSGRCRRRSRATPWALKAWATRVVPVKRSSAVRAPEAWQIRVRTGTRRRLEPRYLIIVGSRRTTLRWAVMGSGDHPGGDGAPSAAAGCGAGRPGARIPTGCAGTSPTRTRPRTCRGGCARCNPCCAPRSMTRRIRPPVQGPSGSSASVRGRGGTSSTSWRPIQGVRRSRRCWSSSIRPWSPSPGIVPASAGVADRLRIVEGDASQARWYADDVPADIVLVCGVFGNISAADITRTIQAMRGFCLPGGHVIWTRHRRAPDATPVHPGRLRRRRFRGAGLRGSRGDHHDGGSPPPRWAVGALRPRPGALRLRRRRLSSRMTGGLSPRMTGELPSRMTGEIPSRMTGELPSRMTGRMPSPMTPVPPMTPLPP